MKLSPASIALAALCVLTPAAFAQIAIQSIDVSGLNTGVKARFTFSVNPTTNALTIDVDNTILSSNGYHGTITSFGFNTPFTNSQLGNNGSKVSFTEVWLDRNLGHSTSKWNKFDPYLISQNAGYTEDFGVGTGNTPTGGTARNGIEFGEQVRFTFTFPDFTPAQVNGFFDSRQDIVVRWQDVADDRFRTFCSNNDRSEFGLADIPPTPEPSTYGLMGAAVLVGIVTYRRRSEKKRAALAKTAITPHC